MKIGKNIKPLSILFHAAAVGILGLINKSAKKSQGLAYNPLATPYAHADVPPGNGESCEGCAPSEGGPC